MSPADQQFWTVRFDGMRKDWSDISGNMLTLVEKSATQAESVKNELATLKKTLEKPFFKTFAFWQWLLTIALIMLFIFLLYKKGGQFEGPGFKYNTCPLPTSAPSNQPPTETQLNLKEKP